MVELSKLMNVLPSPKGAPHPTRFHLSDERLGRTVRFVIYSSDKKYTEPVEGYFTIGTYPDGVPGEVFIEMGKEGEEQHGWADVWSVAISMLLQFGVDPVKIYDKFSFYDFEPCGMTNISDVPFCKSVPDLVMKYMRKNFPPTMEEKQDEYDSAVESVMEQGGGA